jgi:hypothetical protein
MPLTKLIVTMPAYEAAGTLRKTLLEIPDHLDADVIVVDDASSDDTAGIARDLGATVISHPENRGYGANQKTCYRAAIEAGADIVVMLHPDYQYDPKAVPLLIAPILSGAADMTFGSRFAGLSDPRAGGMPRYRFYGNRLATVIQNLLLGTRFTELHSGMRAYTVGCLQRLPLNRYSDGFVFDSELLIGAISSGLRVVEVPIPTRYTKESSSIAIGASLEYVWKSIWLSVRSRLRHGRLGRKSKARAFDRTPRMLKALSSHSGTCLRCRSDDLRLVYEATAGGPVDPEEFRCTTNALNMHDEIVQCQGCGLVSSVPTVGPEQIVDGYTEVTDAAYLGESGARRELFNWVLERVESYLVAGRDLFEVGSHVGLFLKVAEERDWRAEGIEPSKWAVDWGKLHLGVKLELGIVENLGDTRKFDCVAMLDVLEHVVDPFIALEKARKAVRDDGLLVLTTVDIESIHSRLRGSRWPWFIRSHLHYFSVPTLAGLLTEAGFEVVEWSQVPRTFRLSYLLDRAEESLGPVGRMARGLTRIVDPRLPVGWLGDICLVIARPSGFQ